VECKAQFNDDRIKPQRKAKIVKIKAEILTCMNEQGLCLSADVIGSSQGQHQQQQLFHIVRHQLLLRRSPTKVVYVDDAAKFANGFVQCCVWMCIIVLS
jgi:hypothetical protein